ncbi:hypothetical protein SNEBB_010256 [Seison nebaliae]|nr:hypothetical protein SNEBB_010256 [Seison nebaliae]
MALCIQFAYTKNCVEAWKYPHDTETMRVKLLSYGLKTNKDPGLSDEGGYVQFECLDKTKKLENDKVYCENGELVEKSALVCA